MSDKQYWLERWQQQQTGFHSSDVHPALARWYSQTIAGHDHVFVPLCGKSFDMQWLASRGHRVTGVEISELAVSSFIQENSLNVIIDVCRDIPVWRTDDIAIYCGDFFDLQSTDINTVAYVYDRAALVALDKQSRKKYVTHLLSILPCNSSILLITVDYDPNEMSGPPYPVSDEEITDLFGGRYKISLLEQQDVLQEHQRFIEKGLSKLTERVYQLSPEAEDE